MKGFHETKSPEFVLFSSDKWVDKWHMCGVSRVCEELQWHGCYSVLWLRITGVGSVESDGKYAQI